MRSRSIREGARAWFSRKGPRIPNTQHCSDWEYGDSQQTGWIGDSTATDALWTHGIESDCGALAALYCFEQP